MDELSAGQPVLAIPVDRGRLAARAGSAAHRRDRLAGPPPGDLNRLATTAPDESNPDDPLFPNGTATPSREATRSKPATDTSLSSCSSQTERPRRHHEHQTPPATPGGVFHVTHTPNANDATTLTQDAEQVAN